MAEDAPPTAAGDSGKKKKTVTWSPAEPERVVFEVKLISAPEYITLFENQKVKARPAKKRADGQPYVADPQIKCLHTPGIGMLLDQVPKTEKYLKDSLTPEECSAQVAVKQAAKTRLERERVELRTSAKARAKFAAQEGFEIEQYMSFGDVVLRKKICTVSELDRVLESNGQVMLFKTQLMADELDLRDLHVREQKLAHDTVVWQRSAPGLLSAARIASRPGGLGFGHTVKSTMSVGGAIAAHKNVKTAVSGGGVLGSCGCGRKDKVLKVENKDVNRRHDRTIVHEYKGTRLCVDTLELGIAPANPETARVRAVILHMIVESDYSGKGIFDRVQLFHWSAD